MFFVANNGPDRYTVETYMSEKPYQNIKIEPLAGSKVKISGEISTPAFEKARKAAIEHAKNSAEIPGFRAGKAPENLVINHVGDIKILERAAESVINDVYADIIDDHKVRAIGMPTISITKIAAGNPLGFVLETFVMPEISLSNYKTLAKEAIGKVPDAATVVEEKEVEAVIEDLRKRLGAMEGEGKELPEFNDEFVKKLGDFTNVEAFKEKARTNILEHKKLEVKDKRRAAIADALIAESHFDAPEVIVESELNTMLGQFRADIERNGYTMQGYLEQIQKKEEDIRKEWHESAVRRAKLELILKHIAREEKIVPNEEDLKKEIDHIISHHKTADRFRVRMYVENLMTNQKVFEFLES